MRIKSLLKVVKTFGVKHQGEILTGFGIAGMIASTVWAVKATPKAEKAIKEAKIEKSGDDKHPVKLTPVETVKTTWKYYVPSVMLTASSVACIIGGQNVHIKRNAALAAAYKLSENTLADYKEAIVETIGEDKAKEVTEKVAKRQIERAPINDNNQVVVAGDPDGVWFFEPYCNRYFKCQVDKIKKAINDLNYRMICGQEESITLKELYIEIGIPGDTRYIPNVGWNLYQEGVIDYDLVPIKMENDNPCLMLDYKNRPQMSPDYF